MKKEPIYFTSGNTMLDHVVGGAKDVLGFKAGTIVNIRGDTSTGKTQLVTELIVGAYYQHGEKFKWVYDDAEAAYSFDTQSLYGIDVVTPNMPQSHTVEDAFCNITNFIDSVENDEFGIYVLDSLDSITSEEMDDMADKRVSAFNKGKDLEGGSYAMGKAKFLSQTFFPQLAQKLEHKNVLLVIISQIREKVNAMAFGEKITVAGGRAMPFYTSVILFLVNYAKIERKETIVGGQVHAKAIKGKLLRPFRECTYSYFFDYGIDDVGSMIDYLYDLRGDFGKLNGTLAKNIAWEISDDKLPITSPNVGKFLKDRKIYDDVRRVCPNCKFDLDVALEYINKDEKLKGEFDETFAAVMDRDKLIDYIEQNNLQDELKRRVNEKWEAHESEIATHRVKKYGNVPRGIES